MCNLSITYKWENSGHKCAFYQSLIIGKIPGICSSSYKDQANQN